MPDTDDSFPHDHDNDGVIPAAILGDVVKACGYCIPQSELSLLFPAPQNNFVSYNIK